MPARSQAARTFDRVTEQRVGWAQHPERRCQAIAAAYKLALDNEQLRLPVTEPLIDSATVWLLRACSDARRSRIRPLFVDRPVILSEALAALSRPCLPGEWRDVPVSTVGNEQPHPVWTAYQNLSFRFVHDLHHHQLGADDSFTGELTVARETVRPLVMRGTPASVNLARFLASEIIGQASYRITFGHFPEQVIAANILSLL